MRIGEGESGGKYVISLSGTSTYALALPPLAPEELEVPPPESSTLSRPHDASVGFPMRPARMLLQTPIFPSSGI